jgi:hypothetical protein
MALLAAGDLAVLLAFAAVGRHSHGEPLTLDETFKTALPFIIGKCSSTLHILHPLPSSLPRARNAVDTQKRIVDPARTRRASAG